MTRSLGPVRVLGLGLCLLLLHACATAPLKTPIPPVVGHAPASAPPYRPPPPRAAIAPPAEPLVDFARLPGWDQEDHAAALDMFRAGCGVAKDAAWREVCRRARDLGPQDEVFSKAFLETNFRLQPLADEGLLTGYFSPRYPARAAREGAFTAAVRARPADLPQGDVGAGTQMIPYLDRAGIEQTPADHPLAWMRPEDLFFLQIQGSGVLVFPGGEMKRAVYAANNGMPFAGIAAPMRNQGLLADSGTSGDAIRAWLADHRGPQADAVMRLNPRYIFFTLAPYDGKEPAGASGAALVPGRALAVDPSRHDYGVLYWINAEAPKLSGAFPTYRRLAMALDTGSAIRGEVRADLYLGTGEDAGIEAGRVRHRLKLYRLVPALDGAQTAAAQGRPAP
jgi:membrane-bound lytic murein transglycosylase A